MPSRHWKLLTYVGDLVMSASKFYLHHFGLCFFVHLPLPTSFLKPFFKAPTRNSSNKEVLSVVHFHLLGVMGIIGAPAGVWVCL